MECNTEEGFAFDVGSLYTRFEGLKDKRKRRGIRYSLGVILVLMTLAKICGENHPTGIAEWVKHRSEMLAGLLKLKRNSMPDHSTYGRILAEVVNAEELEQVSSQYVSEKKFFGKQVLLAIDGKVLRGTLNDDQEGTYLLAA